MSVIGADSFAWVYTGGAQTVWLFTLLPVVLLPVTLVQWKMHAETGYTGWLDEWVSTWLS